MSTEIDKFSELDDVATGVGDGEYEAPSQFVRPPDAGEYTFMRVVEDDEKDYKHGRFTTQDGASAAWFNIKAVIQGGPFDSRYVAGGFNTLVSQYRVGSTADDFLRASRATARPKTFKEWEAAVPVIFGPFKAIIDWEWTCMNCTDENDKPIVFLKGMRAPKRPKKYDGARVKIVSYRKREEGVELPALSTNTYEKSADGSTPHIVACPECKKEIGARAVIKSFVVPGGAGGQRPGSSGTVVTLPSSASLPPAEG